MVYLPLQELHDNKHLPFRYSQRIQLRFWTSDLLFHYGYLQFRSLAAAYDTALTSFRCVDAVCNRLLDRQTVHNPMIMYLTLANYLRKRL